MIKLALAQSSNPQTDYTSMPTRIFPHTFADTAARTAETLNELSTSFELRGAKVVATRSIYVKKIDAAATDLVGRVLEHVPDS